MFPSNLNQFLSNQHSVTITLELTKHKTFLCVFADVKEYCEWESFNANCAKDEIIIIEYAKYGRMNLGRCVTKNYGHIGCGTDVTAAFDRNCSGRNQCDIPIISLHDKRSCPKDFKSYLEAGYSCIKGEMNWNHSVII